MTTTAIPETRKRQKLVTNYGHPEMPITETVKNGFFVIDSKWTVTFWNKTSEELLGVKAKDIVGKNILEKLAGFLPINFYAVYHKAFLQDTPVHFQEYWAEMGSWFDVTTYHHGDTLSVSFKSSNHPSQLSSVEQQLKTINELYKYVTEVTNDCLWEWDLQNKEIFWIDGGHKRMFGYPIENILLPQTFWESCLHPDDKERVITGLNKIINEATECKWQEEYRFKKADGEYAYVHDKGHIIYEGDIPARMIGATQDISYRKQLEDKVSQERLAREREITDAVITAQENERAAIGRELHENVNQLLSIAKMYIQMAQRGEKNVQPYLADSTAILQNAIEEIRKISQHLIVPDNHVVSLFDSISNLIVHLKKVYPIKIEFLTGGIDDNKLDKKIQVTIFRIVQEQTNNILKHSNARKASIEIQRYNDDLILDISDNGKGFDSSKKTKGVGLRNITSRSELCNGKVEIISTPGKGFQLRVILPFPPVD